MALRGPSNEEASLAAFVLCERDLVSPAKRADLNVCEADIEPVNGVNDGTVQTLYSTMPLCFCFASCSGAALPTRNTALFSWLRLWSFTSHARSAVLSRWPDKQLARARICNCCKRRRRSGLLWLCGAHDGNLFECAGHCEGAEYAGVPGQLSLAV